MTALPQMVMPYVVAESDFCAVIGLSGGICDAVDIGGREQHDITRPEGINLPIDHVRTFSPFKQDQFPERMPVRNVISVVPVKADGVYIFKLRTAVNVLFGHWAASPCIFADSIIVVFTSLCKSRQKKIDS